MVFKNPYGYLIKRFKTIHLVLVVMYAYLAFKVNSILQYYNQFIEGTASKLDALSYVDQYYLIVSILSIVVCLIVYALMRYKKKPRVLYLFLMVLYIVVPVMIFISYRGLNTIYFSVLETKTLRLYRDLLQIVIWVQYASILIVLARGLGFDVKKFNFVQDLAELNLDEKDEEEIELALGGTESVQRRFHRRVREFRYYFLENKLFIILVVALVLIFSFGGFFFHEEVVNKEYNEGEVFSSLKYQFNVLNTYVTNRDIYHNYISSDDTSFVVVKMKLATSGGENVFNTSQLILNADGHKYSSDNSKYASKFSDLGYAYKGSKLSGSDTYLFIYRVDNAYVNGVLKLNYLEDKVVRLRPIYLDNLEEKNNCQINQKIDFSDTVFQKGYMLISSYEVSDKFAYSYEYEVMGKKNKASLSISSDNGIILHLVTDVVLPFGDMSLYSFLSSYGKLMYKVGDTEYSSSVFTNKTPGNYKDGLYLVVDREIEKADSIWFQITIRQYQYIYTLK